MADTTALISSFRPIGVSGLKQFGGYVDEEYLRPLRDTRRFRTYAEMATEPIIAASLLAIELLMRRCTWSIEPNDESPEAEAEAEFVRGALFDDMATTWPETMSDILSMLVYGWHVAELVYKRRQGPKRDPLLHSMYSDGRIGWQGFEGRSQDTLSRWEFDSQQRLVGFEQRPWQGGGTITIPEERFLLFRMRSHKQNPEGVSLIRSTYTPWYYKKEIQKYQAIGIERDLAGLPVMYVPIEILNESEGAHAATYNLWKDAVQGVRRNENEGVLMPAVFDEHGNRLYELVLLTSGGARQFDTTAILQAYNLEIVIALFTDILLVGHERVGSFALASSKTTMLATALGAILDSMTTVVNRTAIPRLWRLNGLPQQTMPYLAHGDIEAVDLNELGTFITQMSQAGFDVSVFESETWRRAGFQSPETAT